MVVDTLIDWHIHWLTHWLIDCMAHTLIQRCFTHWLIDCHIRLQSNFPLYTLFWLVVLCWRKATIEFSSIPPYSHSESASWGRGRDGEERGRGREGGRKEYPQSLLHAAHDKRQIWEEAEEKVNTFYLSIRLSILDEVWSSPWVPDLLISGGSEISGVCMCVCVYVCVCVCVCVCV